MSDSEEGFDLPLGTALMLAAYLVGQEITNAEPAGDVNLRMERALVALAQDLKKSAPEYFVVGQLPELSSFSDGWPSDHGVALLVELVPSNPFYPYQFELTDRRKTAKQAGLRNIARQSLRLEIGTADKVKAAWDEVRAADRSRRRSQATKKRLTDPKAILTALGVGAAVAGVAVVAAPAIAVLMPAASGLSGAAAVSAGLAQLGFGSIASGGLGMVGGLWVLGAGGAAAGAVTASTAILLAQPGSAALVGLEVKKLMVSYALAQDGVIARPPSDFARSLEPMEGEVDRVLTEERTRNEENSDRIRELRTLQDTLASAGEFMTRRDPKP